MMSETLIPPMDDDFMKCTFCANKSQVLFKNERICDSCINELYEWILWNKYEPENKEYDKPLKKCPKCKTIKTVISNGQNKYYCKKCKKRYKTGGRK